MARPNNAAAIGNHVQGLREAKAAFQALPQVTRDRLNNATFVTVSEIARIAKAHLQSSPSIQTRSLYNAIAFTMNEKNGRGRVGIASGSTTLNIGGRKIKVKGIIVPGKGGSALTSAGARKIVPSKYGPKVEFGTRFMNAEPFMTPATDSQEKPYLARCLERGKDIERDLGAIGTRTL